MSGVTLPHQKRGNFKTLGGTGPDMQIREPRLVSQACFPGLGSAVWPGSPDGVYFLSPF